MSQANIYEQFMLELINAERSKIGAQPLAFNGDLNESSEIHSSWMISTDTFSHTGAGGSSPGDRMTAAGYNFSGSWTWGENIAWMSTRVPTGLADEVQQLHTMLMNSSGHRANILNDSFREIGVGFEIGE
ncbi:CAP domain-containing protein, partial [Nitrosomonas sp.]|uniref:CAP domain-containing protein n=1 Tax=Nitrosomonas sp. TaxID=42353 RepID=UPI001D1A71C1